MSPVESVQLYSNVPPPIDPSSVSKKTMADFDSPERWKEELFRHSIEVCRILCPDYWSKNRNLFSVASKTAEDLAQTVMMEVWTKRYSIYIQREIDAAAKGEIIVIPEVKEVKARPAVYEDGKLVKEEIKAVKAKKEHVLDPWERTISLFRKQFYKAAEKCCKIQNRFCRAGKRYNEEKWATGIDESDDKHFGFLDPETEGMVFSEMEARILAMNMAPSSRGYSLLQIKKEFQAYGLDPQEINDAIVSIAKKLTDTEDHPNIPPSVRKQLMVLIAMPNGYSTIADGILDTLSRTPKATRKVKLQEVEQEFLSLGLDADKVREAVVSIACKMEDDGSHPRIDKVITKSNTDIPENDMTTSSTTETVISRPAVKDWVTALKESATLNPLDAAAKHAAYEDLISGSNEKRSAAVNLITSGMMSSMISSAMSETVSGRWKAREFALRSIKATKQTVREWCATYDSWNERKTAAEADIVEQLNRDEGELPTEREVTDQQADFTKRYNEFNKKSASGEMDESEVAKGEKALDKERSHLQNVRDRIRSRSEIVRMYVAKAAPPATKQSLYGAILANVPKILHSPGPSDMRADVSQSDARELREAADEARSRGLLPSKPKSALIAELVETWPQVMQDALYDSLLEDMNPDQIADRINNVKANARGLLQADYRVLSEYFKVELNAASNPMVALRAINHRIAENKALGENLPTYVKKVLEALNDVCMNGTEAGTVESEVENFEQVIQSIPKSSREASALSTMRSANVVRRGDKTFEVMPVKCPVKKVWEELQECKEWKHFLTGLNLKAEFEPKDGDETKPGGKILLTGDMVGEVSQKVFHIMFKALIMYISGSGR